MSAERGIIIVEVTGGRPARNSPVLETNARGSHLVMAPSKSGTKSQKGPLPPTPSEQEDRYQNSRPMSQGMPGGYVSSGQAPTQGQMVQNPPEENEPVYRDLEPPQQSRRQDQKSMPQSLRDRDNDGRRGHGSMFSGLHRKLEKFSDMVYSNEQYGEPEGQYVERGGGRSDNRRLYDDRRDRRQYSADEEVFRLRQELDQKQGIIESLKSALKSEQLTTSKVKLSADKMQLVMDNKDLFVGVQQNDDVILTKFRSLFGQITTWSKKFSKSDDADFDSLSPRTRLEFERVAPGCLTVGPTMANAQPKLWDSGKRVRMLIQGWVGLIISERMFRSLSGLSVPTSAAKDVWLGDSTDRNVGSIEYKLVNADRSKVTLRDLHDWRSLTIELLSRMDMGTKIGKEKDDELNKIGKEIMDVAVMWAPIEAAPDLHERLLGILAEAMTFSQLLRRQRACWSIVGAPQPTPTIPPREGSQGLVNRQRVAFNRMTMKDHGEFDDDFGSDQGIPPPAKAVELFITPGLFKRGDADGQHFETESCISAIQVLCFDH